MTSSSSVDGDDVDPDDEGRFAQQLASSSRMANTHSNFARSSCDEAGTTQRGGADRGYFCSRAGIDTPMNDASCRPTRWMTGLGVSRCGSVTGPFIRFTEEPT